ncbi:hypothetical protein L914_12096 [Phytophthora nicotianae]|uniref:Uncharacterized protein n=1 Tax=Phytophthora nicotianae TaxID=4792 RepID=W2N0Y4_PHYNI|nr:hypothetical protein L914_12096 [Phytophthora nicotianae]
MAANSGGSWGAEDLGGAELSKTRAHGSPMDCRVGLRASQLERGR